jgi:adenylate cyclase
MAVTILERRSLGAQTVRGTVLFADLRGYTTIAERLSPSTVVTLLEEFFGVLADAIDEHGGTVYHSAGDSLMAGFGLSEPGVLPIREAVDASRQIVSAFAPVSAHWESRFGVATGVGVGAHVGELAVTDLGPPPCRHRTLIGDTVNVAARLCQRARAGEVLFSASIAEPLGTVAADVIALPAYTLRGREAPVRIFCVPARDRIVVEPLPGRPVSIPRARP